MKYYFLIIISIYLNFSSFSQKKATTENGESVLLFDDGTWILEKDTTLIEDKTTEILTNPTLFTKSKSAGYLLKSAKMNVGIWYNSAKISISRAKSNKIAEHELVMNGGDLYGMLVVEDTEVPLDVLAEVAVSNFENILQDFKVLKREYRIVNDIKVLYMQAEGKTKGLHFMYNNYYYSNSEGTAQFYTFMSYKTYDKLKGINDEFLNGFVELKK